MTPVTVTLSGAAPCAMYIGAGLMDEAGRYVRDSPSRSTPGACVLITDETVGALYGQRFTKALDPSEAAIPTLSIPPGEASKSLARLSAVFDFLGDVPLGRDGLMIALGGGVVSDLAGFAAATWMRGVAWAVIPTTLEAQIDAAIGGKTAINVPGGKNLVGAFHMPRTVLIDPTCLATLDPRDVRAGLAESVKHALIASEAFLAWHEDHADEILALEPATLERLIEQNVRIKSDVVQRDPWERSGERLVLNFGHTMGHAIEQCCVYALRHGECVALGMLAACRLSHAMGFLDGEVVERVGRLLERFGLPTSLRETPMAEGTPTASFEHVFDVITRDKKARGKQVRWVLLEKVGATRLETNVDQGAVRAAYESLFDG